jgi:hypothetical protein
MTEHHFYTCLLSLLISQFLEHLRYLPDNQTHKKGEDIVQQLVRSEVSSVAIRRAWLSKPPSRVIELNNHILNVCTPLLTLTTIVTLTDNCTNLYCVYLLFACVYICVLPFITL